MEICCRSNGWCVCAVTGRAMACGEAVYHPKTGNRLPLNGGAMILASVIEQAVEC
jgi:hypothetical protein